MISLFRKLLSSDKTDYAQLLKKGAIILDVRTKREYDGGHIDGSMNISIDQLYENLHFLKNKEQPIITCCASGNRSAVAINILKTNGYSNLYDGGGWQSLKNKIK